MIRHIILFKVKSNVSDNEIESAVAKMCALKGKLSGLLSCVGGECQFHDEKSTSFFSSAVSHSITMDFKNKIARDIFLNDPITNPAKDAIVNIATFGYQDIVGFDMDDSSNTPIEDWSNSK